MTPTPTGAGEIDLGPAKLRGVPSWVVAFIAIVVAVGFGWRWIRDPEQRLVTAQQANAALQANLEEYARHIGERTEGEPVTLMDDARGRLVVQRYADGCVVLVRVHNGIARSKLVLDLAGERPAPSTQWPSIVAPVAAIGRCRNPHPGAFRQWTGNRNGCWVPVYRQWPDNCQQVQMFDACSGAWDAQIRWTQCYH